MKRATPILLSIFALSVLATMMLWSKTPQAVEAHCQVPCGIYDDPARIAQLREDATTIAKAIDNINHLASAHSATDLNQMVRWINTKEDHASHIIEVVSQYFLTQKVKPVEGDEHQKYLTTLADHHAVMVAAMKCKQVPEKASVDALNKAIDKLATYYPDKK